MTAIVFELICAGVTLFGLVYAWCRVFKLEKILKKHGWSEDDE